MTVRHFALQRRDGLRDTQPTDNKKRTRTLSGPVTKTNHSSLGGGCQAPSLLTRFVSLETFRAPVFLWITPLDTPRMISGSAAFRAAEAAFLSPEAMASSTLRV